MQWETKLLNPDLKVLTDSSNIPIYPPQLENKVNTIWENEKIKYPLLFNGRVFNATTITESVIKGYWTEYKYVLAQSVKPELYPELQIRSLAVIGLITCQDGFVLGKRSLKSAYLPNYWQSVPAGTVEDRNGCNEVNLYDQLLAELKEEIGIEKEHFSNLKIFSGTEHEHTHIIDIGILLTTNLSFTEIQTRWKNNNNPEYEELLCCTDSNAIPKNTLLTTQFLIKHSCEY